MIYIPQQLPPQAKKKFFIVFVDCECMCLKDEIFTDYDTAMNARESCSYRVHDSFVRGCDSAEEAQSWLNRYTKWSA